jgi:hypothetical protein
MTETQDARCIRHLLKRAQEISVETVGRIGDYWISVDKPTATCRFYCFHSCIVTQSYMDHANEYHTCGMTISPVIFGVEIEVNLEVGYGDDDNNFANHVLEVLNIQVQNNFKGTAAVYMLLFLRKQQGLTSDLLRCLYSFLVHV